MSARERPKTSQNVPKEWPVWRTKRLLRILDLKAQGLNDQKVADKLSLTRKTIYRELNSPQAFKFGRTLIKRAEGMVWPLVERQLEQIEGDDLKPGQRISFRGQLIKTLTGLVPKQVEQRIEQKTEVEVKVPELDIGEVLADYGDQIIGEVLRRALGADRKMPEENLEEPLDTSEAHQKTD